MSDTTTIIGDSTLYQGDVLDVLRTLPDESVQCVVTSPPYWGLRDYGTAEWEGGDLSRGPSWRTVRKRTNQSNGMVVGQV